MFGIVATEEASHEYGQGHLAERASAPKVLEAGERLPSPHKSHTDILDASEDDCDYSTRRKKYMKLKEEARKRKRKNPRAIMALLKDNNLEEHYNAIVEKAKITTIKKGQKMTAHDLEKAGIRTMSQRTNILFALKRADPKMYSGSAGGGSSDSSSGSSSSSSDSDSSTREKNYSKDSGSDIGLYPAIEEEVLKKIFDDNEVGDMFEAAKKAGFTMQLGKNCSHTELKVANLSMMKRFAIIKACQVYERPSRDTPDEVSAGGDSEVNEILKRNGLDARLNDSEEEVLKKIFHDNGVRDKFKAAKKAGFTMQLGKNCSHSELKIANVPMMKRYAIIKACQAYERLSEDTLDEVNAGGDSEEIKRILEKNHLEKYTKTLFNSGYTTIRKCKNLSHGELRAIGT